MKALDAANLARLRAPGSGLHGRDPVPEPGAASFRPAAGRRFLRPVAHHFEARDSVVVVGVRGDHR